MKHPERINKIMERVLDLHHLRERLEMYPLLKKWPELVGERIASHTRALDIDGRKLLIAVDNHLWKAQLYLMKNKIMRKIENMGVKIKDIKFIVEDLDMKEKL